MNKPFLATSLVFFLSISSAYAMFNDSKDNRDEKNNSQLDKNIKKEDDKYSWQELADLIMKNDEKALKTLRNLTKITGENENYIAINTLIKLIEMGNEKGYAMVDELSSYYYDTKEMITAMNVLTNLITRNNQMGAKLVKSCAESSQQNKRTTASNALRILLKMNDKNGFDLFQKLASSSIVNIWTTARCALVNLFEKDVERGYFIFVTLSMSDVDQKRVTALDALVDLIRRDNNKNWMPLLHAMAISPHQKVNMIAMKAILFHFKEENKFESYVRKLAKIKDINAQWTALQVILNLVKDKNKTGMKILMDLASSSDTNENATATEVLWNLIMYDTENSRNIIDELVGSSKENAIATAIKSLTNVIKTRYPSEEIKKEAKLILIEILKKQDDKLSNRFETLTIEDSTKKE